jgi:hypothetical protein
VSVEKKGHISNPSTSNERKQNAHMRTAAKIETRGRVKKIELMKEKRKKKE